MSRSSSGEMLLGKFIFFKDGRVKDTLMDRGKGALEEERKLKSQGEEDSKTISEETEGLGTQAQVKGLP